MIFWIYLKYVCMYVVLPPHMSASTTTLMDPMTFPIFFLREDVPCKSELLPSTLLEPTLLIHGYHHG